MSSWPAVSSPAAPPPVLSHEDLALLEAKAHELSRDAIAAKTGIPRSKVPARIDQLLEVAAAISAEHLVTRAHGWQLLRTPQIITGADADQLASPATPQTEPVA
ncbi:hypothetical protein ACWDCL_28090 [Streptomyces sp. NPDC001009]